MIKKCFRAGEFCEIVGISMRTLDRRVKDGTIKPIIRNNRRYFMQSHIDNFLGIKEKKSKKKRLTIAYGRVSSQSQKKELKNQMRYLEEFSINKGIIIDEYLYDIGSGINFKRKNLQKLIELILQNKVKRVIITYKDRLARFAFELLEWLFELYNVKLEVINLESSSPQKELIEDLMTIIHVFSSRLYGLRKYKSKIKKEFKNKNESIKD